MIAWVIGSGGLLGSSLVRSLKNRGISHFEASQKFSWQNPELLKTEWEESLREFSAAVAKKGSWQIHWAAGTGTMASAEDELSKETHAFKTFLGVLNKEKTLLALPGVLTFASSAGGIYAGCTDDIISEDTPTAPTSTYAREKLAQEELLRSFITPHDNISLFIARFSTLYGAAQSTFKKQGLLSHIARSILRRTPIHIYVPLDTIRDYLSADDAAEALIESLDLLRDKRIVMKIIASEDPTTIAEIIGLFKRISRIPPRIVTSANALGATYSHRIRFKSQFEAGHKHTNLLVGIADILSSERKRLAAG